MAKCKAASSQALEDGLTLTFGAVDSNALAEDIHGFFTAQGYRLEGGTPFNAVYGTGNDVLRILFGAFVKRYKFTVIVRQVPGGMSLTFQKGMSGAMGGVIGYSKMKKETARISQSLRQHFA